MGNRVGLDYATRHLRFRPGGDLIYLPPLVDESLDKLEQELLAAGHESKARIDFHWQY